ncbi:MAG: hypothetical protein KDA78_17230 [Planctomycetaceae bacterium]|nr:hypothetical protein [Planctomycetaceae bacterium]
MADLTDLSGVSGSGLSVEQIRGILSQIDLDVLNLLRDGKLSALKYGVGAGAKASVDRGANLMALLKARVHYEELLRSTEERIARESEPEHGGWEVSQGELWEK